MTQSKLLEMRARSFSFFFVICFAVSCQAQQSSELKALYDSHRWNELYDRLQGAEDFPFYRGVVGVVFHQEPKRSEELLLSVIHSAPSSPEAYEAYEWLSHSYFYQGQYQNLISIMEKRWAAFPQKKDNGEEQAVMKGFRGLPNQTRESTRVANIPHSRGSIFIPFSINGQSATYFFDTGAWVSCMSESEAKRLHLTIRNNSGTLGQATGTRVGFRTAIAQDVVIGNTHFKNVSFAVFPNHQEPWSSLKPGRRGIIGIPLLVGLQALRWNKAGTMEVAMPPQSFAARAANLRFDNDHLVVTATIQEQGIEATVDTGALTTDLYQPFADKFKRLLEQHGKKDLTEVRGVGHAEKFNSITLPELRIQVGDAETILSPAHVLLQSIGAKCCVGNLGLDVLTQTHAFQIDFSTMRLQLIGDDKH